MSSVVIAGDTSGTCTLQAPAVAGSTVLTLPAQTGTVMVNGPAFSAYANASLSISSATDTKVNINTVIFDTASCFSTANNRFTPTVAGYYQVNGCVRGAATSLTSANSEIYKNGSLYAQGGTLNTTAISSAQMVVINTVVFLNGTTDYLELWGVVTGTSPSFNYFSVNVTSTFSAALIRSA
jgi:hypothetical protein